MSDSRELCKREQALCFCWVECVFVHTAGENLDVSPLKKKMVLLPNLVLVQHNPVSMGTKSLRSEDVKQLVGFDECVCLPQPAKARWERSRERAAVACTRLG